MPSQVQLSSVSTRLILIRCRRQGRPPLWVFFCTGWILKSQAGTRNLLLFTGWGGGGGDTSLPRQRPGRAWQLRREQGGGGVGSAPEGRGRARARSRDPRARAAVPPAPAPPRSAGFRVQAAAEHPGRRERPSHVCSHEGEVRPVPAREELRDRPLGQARGQDRSEPELHRARWAAGPRERRGARTEGGREAPGAWSGAWEPGAVGR